MLRSYIEGLYRNVENMEKERELAMQSAASESQVSVPAKRLEQQLIEFLRTQSPEQLARPWTMDEFVMRLDGQWRDRPHPQQIGIALRKLGWQRQRIYGAQGDGRRYWLFSG